MPGALSGYARSQPPRDGARIPSPRMRTSISGFRDDASPATSESFLGPRVAGVGAIPLVVLRGARVRLLPQPRSASAGTSLGEPSPSFVRFPAFQPLACKAARLQRQALAPERWPGLGRDEDSAKRPSCRGVAVRPPSEQVRDTVPASIPAARHAARERFLHPSVSLNEGAPGRARWNRPRRGDAGSSSRPRCRGSRRIYASAVSPDP